jgi:hypothetical protein
MVPFLLYYGFFAQQDAIWAKLQVQENVIPSPPLWALTISLGLFLPFALIGTWLWLKEKQDTFVPIWALVQLLVVYLPLPYAGRFLLAWIVPVGTLAAYGLEKSILPWIWRIGGETVFSRISATPYDTIRRLILIFTIPSTLLVVLLFTQVAMLRPDYPLFLPNTDVNAVSWLAQNTTTEDIVLAHYPVGNYLPRQAPAQVFLGQKFLTVDMDNKLSDLSTFWQEATTPESRASFLKKWHITYVYVGTYEQALIESPIIPLGKLVYDVDGVKIYDVHNP